MRLIDGDALQQEFEDLAAIQCNKDAYTTCARMFKESAERVEDAKTIDATCVVSCKDCEHWQQFGNDLFGNCGFGHGVTDIKFYCRDGERKTE